MIYRAIFAFPGRAGPVFRLDHVKAITSEALTDTKFYYSEAKKFVYKGSIVRVSASYRPRGLVICELRTGEPVICKLTCELGC